jgi:hypothetical protein
MNSAAAAAHRRAWRARHDGWRRSRRRRHGQAGFIGLTDVILGLAVLALALPAVIALSNQQTREIQDEAAAQQLKAVGEATAAFVRDHFGTLYANMGAGTNLGVAHSDIIDVPTLITAAYLPVNFRPQNSFGQSPVVLLRRVAQDPPSGTCPNFSVGPPACKQLIEALIVTTGGTALDRAHASHIATLAGAHAGIIDDSATSARGSFGSWCVDFDLFGGPAGNCPADDPRLSQSMSLTSGAYTWPTPAKGGLAMAMFFNGSEMMSEYLNRFNTGNSEDNTMHTDIDMGDNTIKNVHAVQVAGVDTTIAGADLGLEANRMNMINSLYNGTYTANAGNLNATSYTATGNVTGNAIYGKTFWYSSDARLKANIRPLDHALERLLTVRGVTYDWRANGEHDVGVVAQNVAQAFPELVGQAEDGTLRVKYGNFVGPLIEAVRELSARNEHLEKELHAMEGTTAASPAPVAEK